jgi:hypothetical protein
MVQTKVRFVILSLNQCSSCRKLYYCCVFVFFYFSYLCHVFLDTVFLWRSAPLFYCFMKSTSSSRSLYVLDKSSSCWPVACKWKATSMFCVTNLLFLNILWFFKIWLVAQNMIRFNLVIWPKVRFGFWRKIFYV